MAPPSLPPSAVAPSRGSSAKAAPEADQEASVTKRPRKGTSSCKKKPVLKAAKKPQKATNALWEKKEKAFQPDAVTLATAAALWTASADDVILRPKAVVKMDTKLRALLKDWTGTKASRARDLFLALATCNTIVPIVEHMVNPTAKLVEYQRESPDE
ncbi:hypothetical protein ZWY2020_005979 [Hordeum vulgare]|nr:hypothetical protein ZWY2020_005979 [Hordeum vulgare]